MRARSTGQLSSLARRTARGQRCRAMVDLPHPEGPVIKPIFQGRLCIDGVEGELLLSPRIEAGGLTFHSMATCPLPPDQTIPQLSHSRCSEMMGDSRIMFMVFIPLLDVLDGRGRIVQLNNARHFSPSGQEAAQAVPVDSPRLGTR
jgi:hypothetical protein